MPMLSEDDLNLRDMTREELDAAWDLWFDLAQTTNDDDPLFTHGVFAVADVTLVHPAESAPRRQNEPSAIEPVPETGPKPQDS